MKNILRSFGYRCAFVVALLLSTRSESSAQIITTIAGTGTGGFSGDGGQATAANIDGPTVIAFDTSGNLYFPDYSNSRIRKINAAGIITTVVGTGSPGFSGDGGPATAARLAYASFVTFRNGEMFIADYYNHRIRKVNTSGIISTIAGSGSGGFGGDGGPATSARLYYPTSIGFDRYNNMYIVDEANDRVRKVTTSGIISTLAGGGSSLASGIPATSSSLNRPGGITIDTSGNIYIADVDHARICKVDIYGILTKYAGTGTAGYGGDGAAATAADLNHPLRLAMDSAGALYVGDQQNNRARVISSTGIITTIAGNGTAGFSGDGGAATAAKLWGAQGVCKDKYGNIYIADADNKRIRKISTCILNVRSVNGSTVLCIGDSTGLSDTTLGGVWSSSAPGIAMVNSSGIVTGLSAGTVTISYTVTNSCGSGYAIHTITVTPAPNAGTITGIDTICAGTGTTLADSAAGGTWLSSNNAIATVDLATGSVSGLIAGLTTVYYVVTNSCGSDTARHLLHVRDAGTCPTGVGNIRQIITNFQIAPNPNKGSFVINLASPLTEELILVITNILGQKVKELIIRTNVETAVKLDAPAGIYFITAEVNGKRVTEKVVIE